MCCMPTENGAQTKLTFTACFLGGPTTVPRQPWSLWHIWSSWGVAPGAWSGDFYIRWSQQDQLMSLESQVMSHIPTPLKSLCSLDLALPACDSEGSPDDLWMVFHVILPLPWTVLPGFCWNSQLMSSLNGHNLRFLSQVDFLFPFNMNRLITS